MKLLASFILLSFSAFVSINAEQGYWFSCYDKYLEWLMLRVCQSVTSSSSDESIYLNAIKTCQTYVHKHVFMDGTYDYKYYNHTKLVRTDAEECDTKDKPEVSYAGKGWSEAPVEATDEQILEVKKETIRKLRKRMS